MDYIKEFSSDCKIRGFTRHTIESYRSDIRDFLNEIDDPAIITQADLRKNLAILIKRNYRGSTLKSYYAALNAFYEFLIFERLCTENPIPAFRKRYLKRHIKQRRGETRQVNSIDEIRQLIKQSNEIRIIAIPVTFAKTGLRRGEFLDMKEDNIDLDKDIIHIPHKAKRNRQIVFMDDELHLIMEQYLKWRQYNTQSKWLWINDKGYKMRKEYPGKVIATLAQPLGLHVPNGPLNERLTPHCFRHFFTTHLYRAGMDPQHIKWLRGDSLQKEAWQIYNHIDPEEVREGYLKHISEAAHPSGNPGVGGV